MFFWSFINREYLNSQEYHQNNHQIVLNDTIMKQTVYIYNCQNCTIVVKGKINAITIGLLKTNAIF